VKATKAIEMGRPIQVHHIGKATKAIEIWLPHLLVSPWEGDQNGS